MSARSTHTDPGGGPVYFPIAGATSTEQHTQRPGCVK